MIREHEHLACAGVLVVDDDGEILEGVASLLSDEGYVVSTGKDGREALRLLRSRLGPPPCIILLDLMMPVMNGLEFLEERVRDPALAAIPVALFTADDKPESIAQYLNIETILMKPIDLDLLVSLVGRHCARSRL